MDKSRRHLYVTLGILAAGLAVAVPVYLRGAADESLPFELTADGKRYSYDVERLSGKQGVIFQQLGDAISSALHGWRLGITIGVLACIVALTYFLVATRKQG
jgi:hypothetical protein